MRGCIDDWTRASRRRLVRAQLTEDDAVQRMIGALRIVDARDSANDRVSALDTACKRARRSQGAAMGIE